VHYGIDGTDLRGKVGGEYCTAGVKGDYRIVVRKFNRIFGIIAGMCCNVELNNMLQC